MIICKIFTSALVMAACFDTSRRPRKVTVSPSMIIGADEGVNDYFVLNLPQVVDGRKVITLNRATNGEANIDRNPGGGGLQLDNDHWYHVRVELLGDNKVAVSIDGDKVFEQQASAPTGHYAVAGYDEATGETVVKIVNSTDEPYKTTINLQANEVEPQGKVITLTSASKTDENTMENPTLITPVESSFDGFAKKFDYTFAPNSFTILRIKSRL